MTANLQPKSKSPSQSMTSRMRDNVNAAAAPQLGPGERIEATLPLATSGMSPWLAASFGAIGALIGWKAMERYSVVVTDRRLLLMRQGGIVKAAYTFDQAYPGSGVRVASYKPGMVGYGKLVLDLPAGSSGSARQLGLSFHRGFRKEAEEVATALGHRT